MSTKLEQYGFDSPIVAQNNKKMLDQFGPRAIQDYRENKRDLLEWLLTEGKNPFKANGYSPETVRKSHYKIEKTYRWVWKDNDGYRWKFTPERASEYLDYLIHFAEIDEPQIVEYKKAIKLLFKYWTQTTDANIDWNYDRQLQSSYKTERDHLRAEELRSLYEASLSHNTMPIPDDIEKARDRKGVLARRFDTPIEEITEEDFKRANSWKIPSLISLSNDLGLRPREIEIAKPNWLDLNNQLVRIPAEDAVKSSSSWQCAMSTQTVSALERWLTERELYTTYCDTNKLWLNETGTPYNNRSLNYLLDKLKTEGDIEESTRNLTWYSIRHGVATMWANQEGVQYAQEQLRHEKPETTMGYVHSDKQEQIRMADEKW